MVRSMYSGVAGMKAHQTRMDVIGNNIANVNTYGYKSSRATFRDMYYQNIRNAAEGTATRGGISPSAIGYGSAIGSVDLMMTQSSFTSTGNPLDAAISGEGFFQVMDNDGNIFYTKAGMLDIDSNGNLIDTNGYFVLGTSGDPLGKSPASEVIRFSIPNVSPGASSISKTINGTDFTISASNNTTEGNVSFSFVALSNLPAGQDVNALINGSTITIQLNSNTTFTSIGDLQSKVNTAITTANGGVAHPAGDFKFTTSNNFANLTGAEICGTNYGYNKGSVTVPSGLFGGVSPVEVSDQFTGDGTVSYSYTHNTGVTPPTFTLTATVTGTGAGTYSCILTEANSVSGSAVLKKDGTSSTDYMTLKIPTWATLTGTPWPSPEPTTGIAVASEPSDELGLSSVKFVLEKGTLGGEQTVKDLTGIAIGADGTIIASHGVLGELTIGRIELATFDNPRGLQQSGSSYYAKTPNSGEPSLTAPGENGSGALVNSALEMSNVDLSQEFSDMITTQRGFQANSRMITVSDTMLEELINLKR